MFLLTYVIEFVFEGQGRVVIVISLRVGKVAENDPLVEKLRLHDFVVVRRRIIMTECEGRVPQVAQGSLIMIIVRALDSGRRNTVET